MRILFEVEHEQNARAVFFLVRRRIQNWMRGSDDREKMIGLLDRIRAVTEMICAPQQTGTHCLQLAFGVTPVALQSWKTRFVNDTDNALTFHGNEVDPHEVVMRQVNDAVAGE